MLHGTMCHHGCIARAFPQELKEVETVEMLKFNLTLTIQPRRHSRYHTPLRLSSTCLNVSLLVKGDVLLHRPQARRRLLELGPLLAAQRLRHDRLHAVPTNHARQGEKHVFRDTVLACKHARQRPGCMQASLGGADL